MTVPERDPDTNAIVRASGVIAFEDGEVSTFDIGYTAGTVLMDLQLLGTIGVIEIDDFVLDWANSWAFQNPLETSPLMSCQLWLIASSRVLAESADRHRASRS